MRYSAVADLQLPVAALGWPRPHHVVHTGANQYAKLNSKVLYDRGVATFNISNVVSTYVDIRCEKGHVPGSETHTRDTAQRQGPVSVS